MNYIILNGVNSNDLEGLLISSLPPISKPQIRTNVQEIDGRDGDIVTKLGYAAYDKEIKIGLSYNYDVDEIIQYFNSEGTVTFSNEPNKYYKYEIIDSIDFEKLINFKEATVKMHVQPFKYSNIENVISLNTNLLNIPDFTKTTNGITVSVSDNVLSLSGTGTAATEFYVPITPLTLSSGSYTLNAASSGTGYSACSIRLIQSAPSNAQSFGGNYVALSSENVSLNASITSNTTYNYLWFYITSGTALDFTLNTSVSNNNASLSVRNNGNYFSRPTLSVVGNGVIGLYINDSQVFNIDLSNSSEITINCAEMNAYYGDGTFANRIVTGDYDDCILNVGNNVLTWVGRLQELNVSNYSRWL